MVAQLSLTVASASIIAGAFVSGWIVERLGARRTLFFALVAFGLFGAVGLGVRHAPLLLASRMAVGGDAPSPAPLSIRRLPSAS